jgi:hypothetical protein
MTANRLKSKLKQSLTALCLLGGSLLFASRSVAEDNVLVVQQNINVPYRLISTANTYMFLKLDTRTGEVWQIQWSTKDENRFTEVINSKPLCSTREVGRFTLYPTKNFYNYILLDQIDGREWQVQWGDNIFFAPFGTPRASSAP